MAGVELIIFSMSCLVENKQDDTHFLCHGVTYSAAHMCTYTLTHRYKRTLLDLFSANHGTKYMFFVLAYFVPSLKSVSSRNRK